MPKLGNIVAQLNAARRAPGAMDHARPGSALPAMNDFGSNPGELVARCFIPHNLKPGAPLVVVLHGCTQNAALYDRGSGWSKLAQREGFALLYPEQVRANNSNLCFNWYQPGDAGRSRGEAASICQMIAGMVARHGLDESRVFVTGLSAGGAMASVMLATYPDVFAGGAVIAGLPFASARTLSEALAQMRNGGSQPRGVLAERARAAASRSGPIPMLSVWHGTQDAIVDPANATALIDQWLDLHGLAAAESESTQIGRHRHECWRGPKGKPLVERYDIVGMGHGIPLDLGHVNALGTAGPHMLDVEISSTERIAETWGLWDHSKPLANGSQNRPAVQASSLSIVNDLTMDGPGIVIDRALRAAGLMR